MSNEELTGLWKCPNCGESIEAEFDLCWNCGTSRDGETPSEFERETEIKISRQTEKSSFAPGKFIISCFIAWAILILIIISYIFILKTEPPNFVLYAFGIVSLSVAVFFVALIFASLASMIEHIKYREPDVDSRKVSKSCKDIAVCPHCMAPNEPQNHFCLKCATPLTSHATIDPLGQIQSLGDTYRKAANKPANRFVLIGMWLIFGPLVFFYLIYFPHGLYSGGDSYSCYPAEVNETYTDFLSALMAFGFFVIYSAILYKVTKNYYKNKRAGGS